jgi:hypothetical protein
MTTKSSLLFILFGSIFVGLCGWFAWNTIDLMKHGLAVKAEVVELVTQQGKKGKITFAPVFRYEFQDQSYTVKSNTSSNPAIYDVGDQATLTIDRKDPNHFITDSFSDRWLIPLITGMFGLLFIATGIYTIWAAARRRRQITQLATSGERIQGQVMSVVHQRKLKRNRRRSWHLVVEANHPVTGVPMTFKSDKLWSDPSVYLHKTVEVHVDRRDSTIYYVVI